MEEVCIELPHLVLPVRVVVRQVQTDVVELPGVELAVVREQTGIELAEGIPLARIELRKVLPLSLHPQGKPAIGPKLGLTRCIHPLGDPQVGHEPVTLRGIRLQDFRPDTAIGTHHAPVCIGGTGTILRPHKLALRKTATRTKEVAGNALLLGLKPGNPVKVVARRLVQGTHERSTVGVLLPRRARRGTVGVKRGEGRAHRALIARAGRLVALRIVGGGALGIEPINLIPEGLIVGRKLGIRRIPAGPHLTPKPVGVILIQAGVVCAETGIGRSKVRKAPILKPARCLLLVELIQDPRIGRVVGRGVEAPAQEVPVVGLVILRNKTAVLKLVVEPGLIEARDGPGNAVQLCVEVTGRGHGTTATLAHLIGVVGAQPKPGYSGSGHDAHSRKPGSAMRTRRVVPVGVAVQ